jgi:hypothetical protein
MIYILLLTKIDGERPIDYDDNNDKWQQKGVARRGKAKHGLGRNFYVFVFRVVVRTSKQRKVLA